MDMFAQLFKEDNLVNISEIVTIAGVVLLLFYVLYILNVFKKE